jgi:two-component system, OmpR family, sensor kinase
MSRVPIRLRVAAGFAVAMALVLTATGLFLHARLGDDLERALDQDLRLRAQDLSQLVRDPRGSLAGEPSARLIERGESFAQLLTPAGRVVDATPPLGSHALLDGRSLHSAASRATFGNLPQITGLDEGVRLLATPVQRGGKRLVLVVGATAENRQEALRSLRTELLIVGPIALLVATGLGYLLAGAGLRTVDLMRARAERISADVPGERLPVPATRDELERLGTTLNEMLERLQAALEREREFVAEAGHELRTPLALMRAELDYALHYARTEDELRAAIRTASEETDRLVALSQALLLIASSDRGGLALQVEVVAVADLVEGVRARFAWRAEALGRPLCAVVEPSARLGVRGDRLRLEQALGNLVDNALRHGAGTIRVVARLEGGSCLLGVSDEGSGFDASFAPLAFERFSRDRGARAGAGSGSGLGLSIVQTIAQAHDGHARIVQRPVGVEVVIRLPDAVGEVAGTTPGSRVVSR